MAITRLGSFGISLAAYDSRTKKITRLTSMGIGGQRVFFAAKPTAPIIDEEEVSGLGRYGHRKKKKKKIIEWGEGWEYYTEPQTPFVPLVAHGQKEEPDYALMMAILEATEEKSLSFSIKVSILNDET